MEKKWIVISVILATIFIGMAFVPGLGVSEDNAMEKWIQDHTIKVNSTTTCKYEQGSLLIKEVYTGEELKERFGIEQFTKELKIPVEGKKIPMEGKVLGMEEGEEKVFVTEKVTVLTSADDPPHWWDYYEYPQWVWFKSGDVYEKRLPINLAWKNTTKDTAKSEILEEGWVDNPIQLAEYVYDPIDGWMSGDGVATHVVGIFGRYHANLWQMSDGNVVANAHHDTPVPHEADELEEAEELVAGFFNESEDTEWRVYEDSYNLDNNMTSPYSNRWCTQINYGSTTWYVPEDYAKIQWAVDNATAGDTVIVRNGTYNENVVLNKSLILLGESLPTIDAQGSGSAIWIAADDCTAKGFRCVNSGWRWPYAGIKVESNGNVIKNNICENNIDGIRLYESSDNTISDNVCENNGGGIGLDNSSNNIVLNNTCNSNYYIGISLDSHSSNNIILDNICKNSGRYGVLLQDSSNNDILNNIFKGCGIFVSHSYENTIEGNVVNNKSLVYLENASHTEITDAGQVILVNSKFVTVRNCNLSMATVGIELWNSSNCELKDNSIYENNDFGIYCEDSSSNLIFNNTLYKNYICLGSSSENKILSNTFKDNGIALFNSNNNIILNNIFKGCGLYVFYSYKNTVEGNTVNERPLIYLEDIDGAYITYAGQVILVKCENITVRSCNLSKANLGVELLQSSNCSIENNTCNNNSGAGIYLEGSLESMISNNICESNNEGVWLQSSDNNIILNNTCENNDEGIHLRFSQNNTITNNIYEDNSYGIYLYHVQDSLIANNICRGNTFGIYLKYQSLNNTIYLNNFINNVKNVYSSDSTNIWNSTEEVAYVYNGTTYENYLGNYWDDFNDVDVNNDGIWDTPYSIDSDNDTYPLVEPWENYFAPIEYVFDTGSPANPYPSIMGNHTGTIKPNRTITVSKLYTYPCVGTGGHTESIKLYENGTLIANGSWNGYVGDWHNITIRNLTGGTPYVTLLENHEYNYTIITGSYPQIHHNASLLTKNGWINCTQFTDANGKRYKDWIPAIRLFSG